VLYAKINGVTLPFLADTGASEIVLSPGAAAQLGLDVNRLDYSSVTQTANGIGRSAPFTADSMVVGDLHLAKVPMQVNQAPMSHSLLGMSFFRRLQSFRVEGGRLYMRWGG
jgi:aspartyl protease family protein